MKKAIQIKLFENLSQGEMGETQYDLHNDFELERLTLSHRDIVVRFRHLADSREFNIKFSGVAISSIDIDFRVESDSKTIDSLYRGRTLVDGEIIDIAEGDKGYFYLEIYDGKTIEFWAESVEIGYIE